VAVKADSAAHQIKGTAQKLKELGVLKPQVDVTSINDSINPNVKARGASNLFVIFFNSAKLVHEAPAAVDTQEATPAAEQEAPVIEVSVEGTAAAKELAAVEGFLQ
jgi:hypothetical protein